MTLTSKGVVCVMLSRDLSNAADALPSNEGRSSHVSGLLRSAVLSGGDALLTTTKTTALRIVAPPLATADDLKRYHATEFVEALLKDRTTVQDDSDSDDDGNDDDSDDDFGLVHDCPVFDGLPGYVLRVAGATLAAAGTLVDGTADIAINWDGGRHHAHADHAAGFCYINDIALAILHLHTRHQRVLYLDLDIHHPDGIASGFAFSNRLLRVSLHLHEPGFFPCTGSMTSIGLGRGKGHEINLPMRRGLSTTAMMSVLRRILPVIRDEYNPTACILQLGCDGLAFDPLVRGMWNLDVTFAARAVDLAWKTFNPVVGFDHPTTTTTTTRVPLLLLGGGGYSASNAARCWTLATIAAARIFDRSRDGDDDDDDLASSVRSMDVPEHQFFESYGPDFRMWIDVSNIPDENLVDGYLDTVTDAAIARIKSINAKRR